MHWGPVLPGPQWVGQGRGVLISLRYETRRGEACRRHIRSFVACLLWRFVFSNVTGLDDWLVRSILWDSAELLVPDFGSFWKMDLGVGGRR